MCVCVCVCVCVKNMDNMICKGWERTWFLKNYDEKFQLEVMELNVGTPLFSIFFDFETKQQEE